MTAYSAVMDFDDITEYMGDDVTVTSEGNARFGQTACGHQCKGDLANYYNHVSNKSSIGYISGEDFAEGISVDIETFLIGMTSLTSIHFNGAADFHGSVENSFKAWIQSDIEAFKGREDGASVYFIAYGPNISRGRFPEAFYVYFTGTSAVTIRDTDRTTILANYDIDTNVLTWV
jgi:hypothetical protein